jgi:site-specific recombinase XerD
MDVTLKHHGPHSLRHACATRLLAEGLSMKEIGDHLGHRKLDTTRVYAKVDLAGLRQVADFNIGGLL